MQRSLSIGVSSANVNTFNVGHDLEGLEAAECSSRVQVANGLEGYYRMI
jgi:hypothetical protein